MFQKHALLPWLNVRDNVSLGLRLRGESRAKQASVADEKLGLVGSQSTAIERSMSYQGACSSVLALQERWPVTRSLVDG